jgi:cell division protein FtsQ
MEAEAYPQEVLAEQEPRYLRRQKPLEIKRRKFGKKAWKGYLRWPAIVAAALAALAAVYLASHFVLTSPSMALLHPGQVELAGNRYVSRAAVLEIFSGDRGRSVLLIPLEERRRQLETLPWVEHAVVRRALPNRLEVELVERVPVAFLRQGSELALVDAHGVILDRPVEGDFHFPVVTGINVAMPEDSRERRMQLYSSFLHGIDAARAGASEMVSEVDVQDATDLKAVLVGLPPLANKVGAAVAGETQPWTEADNPLFVHFGDREFQARYQTLLDNLGQWRATAGRVESIDLRFDREVVVNPEEHMPPMHATSVMPTASVTGAARHVGAGHAATPTAKPVAAHVAAKPAASKATKANAAKASSSKPAASKGHDR